MTSRSSIACFATYRPPVPLDIFSSPADPSAHQSDDEVLLSDGDDSYNQNCRPVLAAALKELLTFLRRKNPTLASECGATPEDAANGRVTAVVFVSERDKGLESLHVALCFGDNEKKVKVLSMAEIYGAETFGGVRMEDSCCIAGGFKVGSRTVGHSLVYVSTKMPAEERRAPWTAVYKTNLADGKTERLTPPYQYDLSPAVSPSGRMVAVANFRWNKWTGEIENLKTHITVMNVDPQAQGGLGRSILIKDGGWPSWGSDSVIFFHRGADTMLDDGKIKTTWGVFRYDMATGETIRVTPEKCSAMTPAAISETKVAVAIIRESEAKLEKPRRGRKEEQYRHIEIFDTTALDKPPVQVTQKTRPKADHFNPSVLHGGARIGYHRCKTDKLLLSSGGGKAAIPRKIQKLQTPPSHAEVGLFRLSDAFPAISSDGTKIAFVDNEFKALWLADSNGLRVVCKRTGNKVFSVVWNPDTNKDTIYICEGPSFSRNEEVEICAIRGVSNGEANPDEAILTVGGFNNAFPSCSPDGTKLVFRSTRDRSTGNRDEDRKHKNLYIMDNADEGESAAPARQLTDGPWTDTHCSWSPTGDWIVFSSTRDKPEAAPPLDNGLDPGYFSVYLVKPTDPDVVIRVVTSSETLAGHVNHPVFSPDGRRIAFASDLAAVSADPTSLPLFLHSVRPYGDIFAVDLDPELLQDCVKRKEKSVDVDKFHRLTHSRYEYSMPAWTGLAVDDPDMQWRLAMVEDHEETQSFQPSCPYVHKDGGESWHMTGQLCLPRRCC